MKPQRPASKLPTADYYKKNDDDDRIASEPYIAWLNAQATIEGDTADKWISVLVQLKAELTLDTFAARIAESPRLQPLLRLPSLYARPPHGLEKSRFCTVQVLLRGFYRVIDSPLWRASVSRYEFGVPIRSAEENKAAPKNHAGSGAPAKDDEGIEAPMTPHVPAPGPVVVGVIDDGIAFAHERFRRADLTTRIRFLWDQNGPPHLDDTQPSLPYGYEYFGAHPNHAPPLDPHPIDIDACIQDSTRDGYVDETRVYRECGYEQYTTARHKSVGRRAGHGTHVLDLACGRHPSEPDDDGQRIVAVQLASYVTAETSGAKLTPNALEALAYILNRADALSDFEGCDMPTVVNMSYGMFAGPHDGSSLLERAIDDAIEARNAIGRPLCVVLPAGNHRLERCHAQLEIKRGQMRELAWRVQPDDRTPSITEIWLPHRAQRLTPAVEVTAIDPLGKARVTVREGEANADAPNGVPLVALDYLTPIAAGGRRGISVWIAHTAPANGVGLPHGTVPAGTWQIRIKNVSDAPITVDAWIQRDDTPMGWPIVGRQSRFEDSTYRALAQVGDREPTGAIAPIGAPLEYDPQPADPATVIKRSGTLNAIATGRYSIVIGGMRRRDEMEVRYSGLGPIIKGPGTLRRRSAASPNALAASDESKVCHGLLAAGTRSGSRVALRGTSIAAPLVARALAQWWAAGQLGGSEGLAQHVAAALPGTDTPVFVVPEDNGIRAPRAGYAT